MRRMALWALALAAAYAIGKNYPDVARYLKMRAM